MTFRYLPDVALADVAFEAEAGSLGELFESCALALTDIMVDPATLKPAVARDISLESDDADRLLYDFLTELIIAKDVDSLLFREYSIETAPDGRSLRATARGEPIDRERHSLRNDVKAVTMHMFGIRHEGGKWMATVVLDI
ncbi:MAG: archease [Nitrososphaerota archaeon]|nr:archease [Nitrososphaerota archaeon]MDG7025858.1 archease [Nitrososphaerota archaeon]